MNTSEFKAKRHPKEVLREALAAKEVAVRAMQHLMTPEDRHEANLELTEAKRYIENACYVSQVPLPNMPFNVGEE